jgi:large subunit ribosomal protein L37e
MVKGKGTQAMGKRHTKVHVECRRCGNKSYHIQNKRCSGCGFPDKKLRKYNWAEKTTQRKGEGNGRMAHKKLTIRKSKNGFRHNTAPKSKPRKNI